MHEKTSRYQQYYAPVGLTLIGVAFLVGYSVHEDVVADLIRDLAIAIIVAGVIAVFIELRRSEMHETEAASVLMNRVIGSEIGSEAWGEIRKLMTEKHQIRRDVVLSFEKWEPLDEIRPNLVRATIKYKYSAYSTTGKREDSEISHELDYQLSHPEAGAPSWERVVIDNEDRHVDSAYPSFKEKVQLDPSTPKVVEVVRTELINVPGSWNLYFTQWTKGLSITFPTQPSDLEVTPVLHPRDALNVSNEGPNRWTHLGLLMPGQGLEFKFTRR